MLQRGPTPSSDQIHRRRLSQALAAGAVLGIAAPAACAAPSGDGRWLEVNGARQWLLVAGPSAAAATILVLHGGPGGSETVLFRHFDRDLEQRLRMAYWDQRSAGRSYDPAAPVSALTLDQHLADLDVVVDRLRADFPAPLILLGHSWGSALGAIYAHAHPEKLAGYIGVSQIADGGAQEAAGYAWALAEAKRRRNGQAVRDLERIGPPPYDPAALRVKNRWVEAFGGYFHPGFDKMGTLAGALFRGETSIGEVRRLIAANEATLNAMWPKVRDIDVAERVPELEIPVAFFLGRLDHQVDSALTARYFERLRAPSKRLIWFEHSAHNPPFEEPGAFRAAVLRTLTDWSLIAATAPLPG